MGRHAKTTHRDGLRVKRLDIEDWTVLIHDAHPGYITWQQYQRNIEVLNGNAKTSLSGAVREGAAMLQGIALLRCLRDAN